MFLEDKNSLDHDQLTSTEAGWSESILFSKESIWFKKQITQTVHLFVEIRYVTLQIEAEYHIYDAMHLELSKFNANSSLEYADRMGILLKATL